MPKHLQCWQTYLQKSQVYLQLEYIYCMVEGGLCYRQYDCYKMMYDAGNIQSERCSLCFMYLCTPALAAYQYLVTRQIIQYHTCICACVCVCVYVCQSNVIQF